MKYFTPSILGIMLITNLSIAEANESALNIYLKQRVETTLQTTSDDTSSSTESQAPNWIDGTELRVGLENDDDNKRSIALRVKLKNSTRLNAESDLIDIGLQSQKSSRQRNHNQAIEVIYSEVLQLINQHEALTLAEQQSALAATEIKYFRQLAQTSDFNPENLLDSELNQAQIQTVIELQKQEIAALKDSMGYTADIPKWSLSADKMNSVSVQIKSEPSLELVQAQLDLKQEQKKLNFEKVNQHFALNAVQLASEHAQNKDNVLSVRFDIQIPFSGPSYNHTQKQQGITQAMYEVQQILQQDRKKSAQLRLQMKQINTRLTSYEKLSKNLEKRISKTTNASLILKLKKEHLNLMEKVQQIHQDSRQTYIEILAAHGMFSKQPQTNWLLAQ